MFRGRGHGRGRPRGSWTYRGRGHQRNRSPVPVCPAPAKGASVKSLDVLLDLAIESQEPNAAKITGSKLVASYNWTNDSNPAIIIPGKPPKWTPIEPTELPEDNGKYYRDKDAARFPKHPLEATIEAFLHTQPTTSEAEWPTPDIVACASTLNSLRQCVDGEDVTFRMIVEVIGDTVHLMRHGNSPTELIPDVRGYGHSFPEHYTTWDADVKASDLHQRILQYGFGGLNCIVRFDGDGYFDDKHRETQDRVDEGIGTVEEVIDALKPRTFKTIRPRLLASKLGKVSAGGMVPQSETFELKTRSVKRRDDGLVPVDTVAEQLPRLWVRQIPTLILAYHNRGRFDDVRIIDVAEKLKDWETSKRETLTRLAALLNEVAALARRHNKGRLELIAEEGKPGQLDVHEVLPDVPRALSDDAEKRWREWLMHGHGNEASQGPDADEIPEIEDSDPTEDSTASKPASAAFQWDDGDDDLTACSEGCQYCGKCTH